MAITVLSPGGPPPATIRAVVILFRSALGLIAHGLRAPGRPAVIERRSGRVRSI